MESYVNAVLIKDEQVLYSARVSIWGLLPLILLGVIFLFLYLFGIVFFVWAYLIYISTELAVTNKRVIAKQGFISRQTIEMFLSKVESVKVNQSILGRIFDYGSVIIKGTGGDGAPFKSISDPLRFRKEFMNAADSTQNQTTPPN